MNRSPSSHLKSHFKPAAIFGLLVFLFQLIFAFSLIPATHGTWTDRYLKLNNWDSFRYIDIAEKGYRIPPGAISSLDVHEGRANVVFFPGAPLAAKIVSLCLGIPVPLALLLVAHFCAWLFWTFFYLYLELHNVPPHLIRRSMLTVALFPAAFFLVTGYTESLFLSALMGFLFFTDRWAKKDSARFGIDWLAAAIFASVMSATRIVSFALAAYPPIVSAQGRFKKLFPLGFIRTHWRASLLAVFTLAGGIGFFLYCHRHFGEWNLYFRLEEIGWQNQRLWFAILNPFSYIPRFFFEHTVDSFNRAAVTFIAILFLTLYSLERGRGQHWKERMGLYLSGFLLFYIPVTGKANANMDSMIRYAFPPFLLLVLALTQIRASRGKPIFSKRASLLILLGGLFSLAVQGWFIWRFVRGHWVA